MVACLELFCVAYKPVKLWDVKVDIHVKCDVEFVEKRDVDLGQKDLQIFFITVECKFGESGEDKACGRRERSAFRVRENLRGKEIKMKGFESIRKISIYLFTCLLFEKIEGFFVLHSS